MLRHYLGAASIALAMTVAAPTASAQTASIVGEVVDSDHGTPIPAATVALIDPESDEIVAGTVTDLDGGFRLERVPSGAAHIVVSFVGYRPQRFDDVEVRSGQRVDLGQVRLESEIAALGEVEVTAERRDVEHRIDRTVYSIADDPMAVGNTATEILESIPSVDVDIDGNVSLRGSGSVAVFLNGRPAPVPADMVADFLAQLPADRVDRVEIIPNPSARYEPEGMAGIINIVLREETDLGLGGSVSATADTRGSFNTNNVITYGRGPLSLSANYSLRRHQRERGRTLYRVNRLDQPLTALGEDGLDDRLRTTNMLGLSADYRIGRTTTVTSSLRLTTYDQAEDRQLTSLRFDDAQNIVGVRERMTDEEEWRRGADLRLGFRHQFDGDDHHLSGLARADFQVRQRDEHLLDQPVDDNGGFFREQFTRFDRTDRRAAFDLDYVRPIGDFRFETGYSGFVRLQERDFVSESRFEPGAALEPDVGLINVGEYALWIHAIYGQLAREWGPFGAQLGVRLESALTDFKLRTTDESFVNEYLSAFPSLFLAYELSDDDRLRGSYSRRVNRPRTDHLNPFPRFDDPLNVYVGNPEIRPEYIDAFELSYLRYTPWGSITVSPYARRSTDVIRYVVTVDDGVVIRTVRNLDTVVSYGTEAVISYEAQAFRGFLSLEGYRTMSDGAVEGVALQNDAFGWGGRVNLTYRLGAVGLPGGTIQAMARYRAPMRTEQGRTASRIFTNVAFRQNLLNDRLSLNVRVADPLGLAGWSYVIDQPAIYQEVDSDWGAQRVALSVAYRFNEPDRRRDRDRPDDDGNGFDEEPFLSGVGEL